MTDRSALLATLAALCLVGIAPAAAHDCGCCNGVVLNGCLNTADFDGGVGYGAAFGADGGGGGGGFAFAHASAFASARAHASASVHIGIHGRSGGGMHGGWGGKGGWGGGHR